MSERTFAKIFSGLHIGLIFGILLAPLTFVYVVFHVVYGFFSQLKDRKNVTGEVAVVTGGARGLGKYIAIELAKYGCNVAVVDINIDGAENVVKFMEDSFTVKGFAYKADITNHAEVVELNKKILRDLGTPTILINNAGIIQFTDNLNPDPREIQKMIDVNQIAHFWTNRIFLPQMKALGKGHIVAISSASSLFPLMYSSVYTSTKFAIRGLMQALRLELNNENFQNIYTTTAFPYVLETNKTVVDRVQVTNFDKHYPLITGPEAAKAIVDAILYNKQEVYLPCTLGLNYRLLELLPTRMKTFLLLKNFGQIFDGNANEFLTK